MKKNMILAVGVLISSFTCAVYAAEMPQQTLPMTGLIKKLQNDGFTIIHEVKFDNGVYKVDAINAQGKDVEAKINPATGAVMKSDDEDTAKHLTTLDAAQKVESAGYKNISSIEASGDKYKVKAISSDGKDVSLTIDGTSGEISRDLF